MKKTTLYIFLVTLFITTSCVLQGNSAGSAANGKILQKGEASWYGPGFQGKLTANGERFNTNELTAAHRTLPFGTLVTVKNLKNGREVTVRINDRGPYAKNRIIDLSKAAGTKLDMINDGVANVQLIIREDLAEAPENLNAPTYTVQIAAYTARVIAETEARTYKNGWVKTVENNGEVTYRVFVGKFTKKADADKLRKKLLQQGTGGFVKQVEN